MTVLAVGAEWLVTGGDLGGESGSQAVGSRGVGMLPRYPAMQRSSTVVWHPEQCSIGVATFEGDPRHATTLLERKLRSQGEISSDVKILILQSQQIGRAYQVLYVTIALDEWQHMLSWSSAQRHLCRLTLAAGLLYKQVKPGHGMVMQVGRHFHFLGRHDGQLVHRQAVAVDDNASDLESVAAMLGSQAREEMAALGCSEFEVSWVPAAFKGDRKELDLMSSAFSVAANMKVEQLAECLGNLAPQHVAVHSGLPGLVQRVRSSDMLNQGNDRMHVLAREYLPLGALAAAVAAVGLAYVGFGWTVDASATRTLAQQLRADAAVVRESTAVIARDTAVQRPALLRQIDMLAMLHKVQFDHDPLHLLDALKQGSRDGIRILSIASERASAAGNASSNPEPASIVVDGTLPENVISPDKDTRSLAHFVKTLADHGYRAVPIDVRSAAAGQGASTRLFSYRITRIESVEQPRS